MPLLDWDQFMERVEHNESLALELAQDLILCVDARLENLEFSVIQGVFKKIEHAAHSLRGLVAPYGGSDLLKILKEIEEKARANVFDCSAMPMEIGKMVMELKDELAVKIALIDTQAKAPTSNGLHISSAIGHKQWNGVNQ